MNIGFVIANPVFNVAHYEPYVQSIAKLIAYTLRSLMYFCVFTAKCEGALSRTNQNHCSWRLLAVPDGSWRLLAASGGFWRFLATPGGSWRLLAMPGDAWRLLTAPGGSWRLLAPPGSSCFPWRLLAYSNVFATHFLKVFFTCLEGTILLYFTCSINIVCSAFSYVFLRIYC